MISSRLMIDLAKFSAKLSGTPEDRMRGFLYQLLGAVKHTDGDERADELAEALGLQRASTLMETLT